MELQHEIGVDTSEEVAEGMNSAFQQDVAVDEGHLEHAYAKDVVVLPAAFVGEAAIVDKTDDQSQHGLQRAASEASNLDSRAGLVEDVTGAGAEAAPVAELVNEVEHEEQDAAGAVVVASGNDAADMEAFAQVAYEAE